MSSSWKGLVIRETGTDLGGRTEDGLYAAWVIFPPAPRPQLDSCSPGEVVKRERPGGGVVLGF